MRPSSAAAEEGGCPLQLLHNEASELSAPGPSGGLPKSRGTLRSWKTRAVSPSFLLAIGSALLAVGAALVATPLALHSAARHAGTPRQTQAPVPAPAPEPGGQAVPAGRLNDEGVPLDAAPPLQQHEGELLDCGAALQSREAYETAAVAAEAQLLGGPAAAMQPEQLHAAVGSLPPLLVGTVFWVLVSRSHPWSSEFPAATAAQVDTLNAAFKGLNVSFRVEAVVAAPTADDAALEQCSSRWPQLASLLLPPAPPQPAAPASGGGGADSPADPAALHVIVCEPEGVRGAAGVLGDTPPEGAGATFGTVLLRRSALWLSRTSLVHQVGHFLGLPHPFPDERQTCKLDGDAIADTPLQYAPNHGCQQDKESDLHVCQGSGDGPLPTLNFMDLTNDTCRWHFTQGQAARMQAMLRAHRPRLYAAAAEAAAQAPRARHALVWESAWQSGLPPAAVQQQQLAAFAQQQQLVAAAATATGAGAGAGALFADPWAQAALAADGQLSGGVAGCACLGPDAAGRRFWTGQLNASYLVDAVRLLLPVQLGTAAGDAGSAGSIGSARSADASEAGSGAAAAPEAEERGAPAPAQLMPAQLWVDLRVGDSLDHTQNQRCSPGAGGTASGQWLALAQRQPLHTVLCQPPVAGRYVTVELAGGPGAVDSQAGAPSQALLQPEGPAAAATAAAACLCEVQPLVAVAPALPMAPSSGSSSGGGVQGASRGLLPGATLISAADVSASSLSVSSSSTAGSTEQAVAAAAAGAQVAALTELPGDGQLGSPACSSSSSSGGDQGPWWYLDTGLDGAWVRSLRLSLPFACQPAGGSGSNGSAAAAAAGPPVDCQPAAPASLTVYVSDTPPAQLLDASGAAAVNGSAGSSGSLCTRGAAVPPGQPVELDCGRLMLGRYVMVVAAAPAEAPPAPPLVLCGVQLLGAVELLLSQAMLRPAPGHPPLPLVAPQELEPGFTLPIDGDGGSCLEAPAPAGPAGGAAGPAGPGASNASWQLQLDGSYPLLSMRLAARGAAPVPPAAGSGSGNGSQLAVSLLDGGGAVVASWLPPAGAHHSNDSSSGGGSGKGMVWELPAATLAAAVRVEGFASLCEVQLLAAAQKPSLSHQLPPTGQWQVLAVGAAPAGPASAPAGGSGNSGEGSSGGGEGSSGGGGGGLASALFDGDPRSCLTVAAASSSSHDSSSHDSSSNSSAAWGLEVLLGRAYRLRAVRLLAGGASHAALAAQAVTISAPAATAGGPSAPPCVFALDVRPWQPAGATCRGGLVTDRLLIQPAAAHANATDRGPAGLSAPSLVLCDLTLFGLPTDPMA